MWDQRQRFESAAPQHPKLPRQTVFSPGSYVSSDYISQLIIYLIWLYISSNDWSLYISSIWFIYLLMGKSRRNKLHKLEDVLVDPNLLAGPFSHSAATLWADTHKRSRRELPSWCAPGPTCQSWDAGSWGTASWASPGRTPPPWSFPPSACTLGCLWCLTGKQTPCEESQIQRECWGMKY